MRPNVDTIFIVYIASFIIKTIFFLGASAVITDARPAEPHYPQRRNHQGPPNNRHLRTVHRGTTSQNRSSRGHWHRGNGHRGRRFHGHRGQHRGGHFRGNVNQIRGSAGRRGHNNRGGGHHEYSTNQASYPTRQLAPPAPVASYAPPPVQIPDFFFSPEMQHYIQQNYIHDLQQKFLQLNSTTCNNM